MPNTQNDSPSRQISQAIDLATQRWRKANTPDRFTTCLQPDISSLDQPVEVQVYHHETFPMGGQLFTVDVRPLTPEGKGDPTRLLYRERISHIPQD